MGLLLLAGCATGTGSAEGDHDDGPAHDPPDAGPAGDEIPTEPQPWVEILGPGQSDEDENSDADGWCTGVEGPIACDDGAPPGSGGERPPTGTSSGTSGTTSGGTGGSSGTTSGGVPSMCIVEEFSTGAGVVPQMLLVVDRSGSMMEVENDGQTRWAQVSTVLQTVTAQLEHAIDFGLSLFPAGGEGSCSEGGVVVTVGQRHADEIAGTLGAVAPQGGTPTAASLLTALAYMRTLDASRPRVVVLATDGAPNCVDGYDPNACICTSPSCSVSSQCLDRSGAIASVTALAQEGISTFVVGIPGTDAFSSTLNDMAVAGGSALPPASPERYYRTTNAQSLKSALDAISVRVSTCRFELSGFASPNTPVEVRVDGNPVTRDPLRTNGWDFATETTVEMYGPACAALADGQSHSVSVRYCPGVNG